MKSEKEILEKLKEWEGKITLYSHISTSMAADILGVTPRTIRNLIKTGKLKAYVKKDKRKIYLISIKDLIKALPEIKKRRVIYKKLLATSEDGKDTALRCV